MSQENLSLIPYASEHREIILRHGAAVVLYDVHSKQISLRMSEESSEADVAECPFCRRPFDDPTPELGQDGGLSNAQPSFAASDHEAAFVNPNYFKLLQHSAKGLQPRLLDSRNQSANYSDASSTSASHKISNHAIQQNYYKTFFVEERELGRGGKGVVLLVRHVIDGVDLGRFACKRVPVGDDSEWLRKVLVEVQLLSRLSHANLVSYRHVWLEEAQLSAFSPMVPCAFILQEYCNGGDLHQYIFGSGTSVTKEELKNQARTRSQGSVDRPAGSRPPRRLHFEEIFSFFKDITSGLHYLHQEGYIHRDLKPSNCLLHKTGNHIRVLVSDFGEMQGAEVIRKSTGNTGTISYCAPEVLTQLRPGVLSNFTKKSDIFSLGLTVHLMCFGRLPFTNADTAVEENEDIDQLRDEISAWAGMNLENTRDRTDLPDALYKFLKILLSLDPNERPSTGDILHSIKTGSSLHEHAHASPEQNDIIDSRSASDGNQLTSELRRRSSAFPRSTSLDREKLVDSRRTSSPRVRSKSPDATIPSDLIFRRSSSQVGGLKNSIPTMARLLPAPETSNLRIIQLAGRPWAWAGIKVALFCFKLWLCLRPCWPLATNSWIAYPLLGLAALDLTGNLPHIVASLLLAVVHVVVLMTAWRSNMLCERVMVPMR